MSALLYEPGFAVLTRRLGPSARRAITAMTLVGGFASTVFMPVSHVLIETFGWRDALIGLAGINLLCAAIHLIAIRPEAGAARAPASRQQSGAARRVLKFPAFWGLVVAAVLHGALFTGFSVHLIPLLVERGFTLDAAVAIFTIIGPAQVAARILIAISEPMLSMRAIGLITTALPALAFAILTFVLGGSWLAFLFAAIYGAANGMMTIVRAVLPIELFGRADYGAIQGMISAPAILSKATGPFLFGLLWAWSGGYGVPVMVALAMATALLLCFAVAVYPGKTETQDP